MPDIQVMFDQPELGPNENKGYGGKTDAEGRYVLTSLDTKVPGAPPGKYRVSLSTYADPNAVAKPPAGQPTGLFYPESPPPPPERVPPKYRQQTFEVPADGTDKADFALKSK
jgi:hypothetical protein